MAATRDSVVTAITNLELALDHAMQGEARESQGPIQTALRVLKVAIRYDIVSASTAARVDETDGDNIVLGVTAHCRCGHSFADDVHVAAASLLRKHGDGCSGYHLARAGETVYLSIQRERSGQDAGELDFLVPTGRIAALCIADYQNLLHLLGAARHAIVQARESAGGTDAAGEHEGVDR